MRMGFLLGRDENVLPLHSGEFCRTLRIYHTVQIAHFPRARFVVCELHNPLKNKIN